MKYISTDTLISAISALKNYNVFYGTTLLACKEAGLPVGDQIDVSIDNLNKDFLVRHYKVHPRSQYFFRVLRFNEKHKDWLRPDYSGKGLQSVNTRTFGSAFVHEKSSTSWGWSPHYVDFLEKNLYKGQKIPVLALACWVFKDSAWSEETKVADILAKFFDYFRFSKNEINALFDSTQFVESVGFQPTPYNHSDLLRPYSRPPDLGPESGGSLSYLEVNGSGCIDNLCLSLGERLNLITGDNGLGKTFILDIAWWALTGDWAGTPAYPQSSVSPQNASIKFQISGSSTGETIDVKYSPKTQNWKAPKKRPTLSGLVIYARVDGSFSVWDPMRASNDSGALDFTREEVWAGNNHSIEGLLRDWLSWQSRNSEEFKMLTQTLIALSPPDLGTIEQGPPIRLAGDHRDTPTITHRYGQVPLKLASAGIRRILTLAYLLVWSWSRHLQYAKETGGKVEDQIVLLLDEAEAHLHPKWQRILLPALVKVLTGLNSSTESQLIVASHSPLVMSSVDGIYEESRDKCFHLECTRSGRVQFEERSFIRHGKVDNWLSSETFGLAEPRSKHSESLIQRARILQDKEPPPSAIEVRDLSDQLKYVLPPDDEFWLTWLLFAEDFGVEV